MPGRECLSRYELHIVSQGELDIVIQGMNFMLGKVTFPNIFDGRASAMAKAEVPCVVLQITPHQRPAD
jgi:hypothetical protein